MDLKELKNELESKLKEANEPDEIEAIGNRIKSIQNAEDLIARQAEKIKELLLATPGNNQEPPTMGEEKEPEAKTFGELADEILKGK